MRIFININDKRIAELNKLGIAQNISIEEMIGLAIQEYIKKNQAPDNRAFGIWKNNQSDGLVYQERVRSEW